MHVHMYPAGLGEVLGSRVLRPHWSSLFSERETAQNMDPKVQECGGWGGLGVTLSPMSLRNDILGLSILWK